MFPVKRFYCLYYSQSIYIKRDNIDRGTTNHVDMSYSADIYIYMIGYPRKTQEDILCC